MDTSNMASEAGIGNAETALLGLLAEGPKHPYQIEKDVQFRDMRAWTDLSMSSIYKVLRKLERRGWVEARTARSPNNRRRRLYQLTPSGRAAFERAVRQGLSRHVVARNPFDLVLYNSDQLPAAEALASLTEYGRGLDKAIECYQGLARFLQQEGCSAARQALAKRTAAMLAGERRWLNAYRRTLEGGR